MLKDWFLIIQIALSIHHEWDAVEQLSNPNLAAEGSGIYSAAKFYNDVEIQR